MKSKFFLVSIFCTIIMLSLSSCEKEDITTDNELESELSTDISTLYQEEFTTIEQKRKLLASKGNKPPITISLENGNELYFYAVEKGNVFIVESQSCENCSALSTFESLSRGQDYSALDLFWAFSLPGTATPPELSSSFKQVNVTNQGWARSKVKESTSDISITSRNTDIACQNRSFTSSIAGGFLGQGPDFVGLDVRPSDDNRFTKYPVSTCFLVSCHPVSTGSTRGISVHDPTPPWVCTLEGRYKFEPTFQNINKWRGKICGRAIENRYHSHNRLVGSLCEGRIEYMGPIVSFQILVKDNNSGKYVWKNIRGSDGSYATFELPANATATYNIIAAWSSPTSFRLAIDDAKGLDEFDLMMDK